MNINKKITELTIPIVKLGKITFLPTFISVKIKLVSLTKQFTFTTLAR